VNFSDHNEDYDDDDNWDLIEVSKVNDKIIKRLLNHLRYDISENFFISFESLLKLGNKVPEEQITGMINELNQIHQIKKELLQFILNFNKGQPIEYHLLPQLYNPDFIVRAKAVLKIRANNDEKYIKFLLPLLEDPDDSVRWSVIEFLRHYRKNQVVFEELKKHLDKELNPVISENLLAIINDKK
jgi:flagellin-specific chaperone FliS